MAENKWTPGPWFVEKEDLIGGVFWTIQIGTHDSIDIHEEDNGEANAKLIAAAPDLAEALKPFVDRLNEAEKAHADRNIEAADDDAIFIDVGILRTARAALLKAQGRAE